ncbi:MAG: hypothetical protein WC326_16020 [Candidatus Delongbacteria bacterium]
MHCVGDEIDVVIGQIVSERKKIAKKWKMLIVYSLAISFGVGAIGLDNSVFLVIQFALIATLGMCHLIVFIKTNHIYYNKDLQGALKKYFEERGYYSDRKGGEMVLSYLIRSYFFRRIEVNRSIKKLRKDLLKTPLYPLFSVIHIVGCYAISFAGRYLFISISRT